MKRFVAALGVLSLAGCEQPRPPSAAVVAARSAIGTKNTNFETKIQPNPPRAGETSVWDFKVYDKKNKPDGTRKEWKFFNALPQSSGDKSITEVLMNTWLISKDRKVFLPQKPTYKAYGSFLGDWTIPQSGAYRLYVEYQPVVAKDELSAADFDLKGPEVLPVEQGYWDVSVGGTGKSSPLSPKVRPLATGEETLAVYSLDTKSYGARAPFDLMLRREKFRLNQKTRLNWSVNKAGAQPTDKAIVMLSPDGKKLLHFVGDTLSVALSQKGKWRAWFSFSLDGQSYAAPVDFDVA